MHQTKLQERGSRGRTEGSPGRWGFPWAGGLGGRDAAPAEVHRIRGLGLCFVGDGKPPEASGCCVLESSRWQQRKVDVSLEEGDGSS